MILETTEPLLVCVGHDVVRRFNVREQRFLFGRAALGSTTRRPCCASLSSGESADLFGNSVRISHPDFEGLGRRNDEQSKQLRKAYSRKALKALEEPSGRVAQSTGARPGGHGGGAGLLGRPRRPAVVRRRGAAGLGLLREGGAAGGRVKAETAEAIAAQLQQRPDLRELVPFAVSDDFFRLRQRLGLSLG